MLTVVEMPSLSPTMQRGKIVKWCKQEEDYVEKAEIFLEVESDKANVEVESQVSGFLRKILIQEGIGVPVNTPVGVEEGLVVPVIQNADQKTFLQISREVQSLAEKARNKRLLPEEYSRGTFTITNLGMFGVEISHAIINPPECAILAAGAILSKPVFLAGEISVRPCLQLSLSVDHRVVNGVLAAQFLGRIRKLVETPFLMLL